MCVFEHGCWCRCRVPLLFQCRKSCVFACSSLGAGAAAGCAGELGCWRVAECRCCVRLRAWALVPLQGAAVCTLDLRHVAMCTLELGCFWAWHDVWAGMCCLGPRLDLARASPRTTISSCCLYACVLLALCMCCLSAAACAACAAAAAAVAAFLLLVLLLLLLPLLLLLLLLLLLSAIQYLNFLAIGAKE